MDPFKTVEGGTNNDGLNIHPLYRQQKEDVERMRTSLLACSSEDGLSVRYAIQSLTVARVYHQLVRIVKYTELMDKLEDKLYTSIENTIEQASETSVSTWMTLLNIQERLQKNFLDSHKLLQPYIEMSSNIEAFANLAIAEEPNNDTAYILSAANRDVLRLKANAVLNELQKAE